MPILPHVFGDHPRGCGAHYGTRKRARCLLGSSPRVRGSLAHRVDVACKVGIIPAGAGLTVTLPISFQSWRDHPRGCGAHARLSIRSSHKQGSSPRVRGSRKIINTVFPQAGIIPAGAGLTLATVRRPTADWDHPRGCGAHYNMQIIRARETGSSPRVRGSQGCVDVMEGFTGIIPAGAGLTSVRSNFQKSPWDHPRGCGAHPPSGCTIRAILGSSPRVRGSPAFLVVNRRLQGIIPAGAGLTCRCKRNRHVGRDHPRGCGAHLPPLWSLATAEGSSPRVRGSHLFLFF